MNDDPLDRAIRSALRDIVAAAPDRHDVPVRAEQFRTEGRRRRPLLAVAVGLTAAAGIVAVVAVSTRSTITTDTAPATTGALPSTAPATTSTTAITTTTISVTTTVAPTPGPLRRVEFRRGTNNTSVSDEILPGTSDRFVLEATAEQRMIVNVDAAAPDITFSIFAPDGTPLAEGEVVAAVELPANGDYVVEVRTTGAGGEYVIDFLIN